MLGRRLRTSRRADDTLRLRRSSPLPEMAFHRPVFAQAIVSATAPATMCSHSFESGAMSRLATATLWGWMRNTPDMAGTLGTT
jgi:hypothetical protein